MKMRRYIVVLLSTGLVLGLATLGSTAAQAAPRTLAAAGSGPKEVNNPVGVAADQASGDVYIAGQDPRIDQFDKEEHFVHVFGWGVADGLTHALQTCTTTCFEGIPGSGAGQFVVPRSIAVDSSADSSSGDVYVSESVPNYRIEKFSASGQFLLMFGGGVEKGPHHPGNICTAANIAEGDTCGAGTSGSGPGEIDEVEHPASKGTFTTLPIAVDAAGNVWVGDIGRLEDFSQSGAFLGEVKLPPGFGPVRTLAIDTDQLSISAGDFYVADRREGQLESVQPPASGTYTLSFEGQTTSPLPASAAPAQIGSALEALSSIGANNVEVRNSGEGASILVEFIGALEDEGLKPLTVSAGSVTTLVPGAEGKLLKVAPDGTILEAVDATGSPRAVGVDPGTGDVYVSDQASEAEPGTATILEYDPLGQQLESFGSGEVNSSPVGNVLAFSRSQLYVGSGVGAVSEVQVFPQPPPGPLVAEGRLSASSIRTTSATLRGSLNPEGAATAYHFEFVTDEEFKREGFTHAISVGAGSLTSGFDAEAVTAEVNGLTGTTLYQFRVIAENINGRGNTEVERGTFQTLPPAVIRDEAPLGVTADAATLSAEVNPLGNRTAYQFEYLTKADYESNRAEGRAPFADALGAPSSPVQIEPAEEFETVTAHITGLVPGRDYEFRLTTENAGGNEAGLAVRFTTDAADPFKLLDDRTWEMVSQPTKLGAELEGIGEDWLIQATANGNSITYVATAPTEPEPAGNTRFVQVFSTHTSAGWVSKDIAVPNNGVTGAPPGEGQDYVFFSSDLEDGVVQPAGVFAPPGSAASLSNEATEATPFLHTSFAPGGGAICTVGCFEPLVTSKNVPAGTEFGHGANCEASELGCGPRVVDATADGSGVVLQSAVPLTEQPIPAGGHALYEWRAGSLSLISELPDHELARDPEMADVSDTPSRGAISTSGARIFWQNGTGVGAHLYMTDLDSGITIRLDIVGPGLGQGVDHPLFQAASDDGSLVFFTDQQRLTSNSGASESHQDLYACAITENGSGEPECSLSDLTPASGGHVASVQGLALAASRDGSWIYYVSDDVEASGAIDGECQSDTINEDRSKPGAECNIYARHFAEGQWQPPKLVAVVSHEDAPDWGPALERHSAGASPSGDWLAFMSNRELTGYNNEDKVSGRPDEEVYLYHGTTGTLTCVSCNANGSRPAGMEYSKLEDGVAGGNGVWPGRTWIAANVPGWTSARNNMSLYQSRYISDSGRLFFNASDSLVEQDSNGNEDAYEYEPQGVGPGGAECEPSLGSSAVVFKASRAFEVDGIGREEAAGCTGLVSSGTGEGESGFIDASEDGSNVFFLTGARLSKADSDTSRDVYDARECAVGSSCLSQSGASSPPSCGTEASCKASPSPQPLIFGSPASAVFSGPGNPPSSASAKPKPKAAAQVKAKRSAKALKACRKKKNKQKRKSCEVQVRKGLGKSARKSGDIGINRGRARR
jgi:hypothetical protein